MVVDKKKLTNGYLISDGTYGNRKGASAYYFMFS